MSINGFQARTFGADLYAKMHVNPANTPDVWGAAFGKNLTERFRDAFIDVANDQLAAGTIRLRNGETFAEAVTAAWQDIDSGFAFPENARQYVVSAADSVLGVGNGLWVAGMTPLPFINSVSQRTWDEVWNLVRQDTFLVNLYHANPVDDAASTFASYGHTDLPKHVIALLLQERVRVLEERSGGRVPAPGDRIAWHQWRTIHDGTDDQQWSDDLFTVVRYDSSDDTFVVTRNGDGGGAQYTWLANNPDPDAAWIGRERTSWSYADNTEAATVSDSTEPSLVQQLQAELEATRSNWRADLDVINEILTEEATARSWCTEYEQVIREKINPRIRGGSFEVRKGLETHQVSGYFRVPFTYQWQQEYPRGLSNHDSDGDYTGHLEDAVREAFAPIAARIALVGASTDDSDVADNLSVGTRIEWSGSDEDDPVDVDW